MVTFHESLMSLASRHFGDVARSGGLGTTRFALQHEAEMRAALRTSVASALVHLRGSVATRRSRRADPADGPTMLELESALVIGAATKGFLERKRRQRENVTSPLLPPYETSDALPAARNLPGTAAGLRLQQVQQAPAPSQAEAAWQAPAPSGALGAVMSVMRGGSPTIAPTAGEDPDLTA